MPFSVLDLEVETPEEAEQVADLMQYELSEMVPVTYTYWGTLLRGRAIRYIKSLRYTIDGIDGFRFNSYLQYLTLNYYDRFASANRVAVEGLEYAQFCHLLDACFSLALLCSSDTPPLHTTPLQDRIIFDLQLLMYPVTAFSYVDYLVGRIISIPRRVPSYQQRLLFDRFCNGLKMMAWKSIKVALNDIRVLEYRPVVLALSAVLKQFEDAPSYQPITSRLLHDINELQLGFLEDDSDSEDSDLEDSVQSLQREVSNCLAFLRLC